MVKLTRWVLIIASIFMGCAVLQAATTKKKVRHPVRHAKVRRYSRSHHYRYRRRYYRRRVRLPRQPSHERITQIQTALARGGYYTGDPNGRWDASTVAAVQKFQSTHNLDATGKLDAPTLQKLGLGSDIAGVASPRPIVPKDCCSAGPAVAAPAASPAAVPAKPANPPASTPAPSSPAPASAQTQAANSSAAASAPAANSGSRADSASVSKPADAQH